MEIWAPIKGGGPFPFENDLWETWILGDFAQVHIVSWDMQMHDVYIYIYTLYIYIDILYIVIHDFIIYIYILYMFVSITYMFKCVCIA